MSLFLVALGLLLVSAPLGLLRGTWAYVGEKVSLACLSVGGASGIVAVCFILAGSCPAVLSLPYSPLGGGVTLIIDGLSAVFLLPAFLIIAMGALHGMGKISPARRAGTSSWVRFFYSLLASGIILVLVAGDAFLFLTAWEGMALAGYFLICAERRGDNAERAGFPYLACTHCGTLALFALFALLASVTGGFALPGRAALNGADPLAGALFLLAVLGFGMKAGIMPLHIWLPRAHAAAPSHVSALMSGVMIKTGVYGIMRVTTFFHDTPAWWGWALLGPGVVSMVLGMISAVAQHDIKRVLAYCSVENIGLVFVGAGVALLGAAHDEYSLFALGMAGALLHVINHGLFKSLLFFSAGAVVHAVGTRDLSRYGGLLRSMPMTGLFFLGGAVAICGLPPLNGFVSEWFIYLGLLHAAGNAAPALALAAFAVPLVALTGALAVLCFTRVFGLSFLGEPPAIPHKPVVEASANMLIAMGVLLAVCVGIGLLPGLVMPVLGAALSAWPVGASGGASVDIPAPVDFISAAALLLIILLPCLMLLLTRLTGKSGVITSTWGCGYPFAAPRARYSASSFAQIIIELCGWFPQTEVIVQRVRGLFPAPASFRLRVSDVVLNRLIFPAGHWSATLAETIRHYVQHGVVGLYLLYPAITIFVLLWLIF